VCFINQFPRERGGQVIDTGDEFQQLLVGQLGNVFWFKPMLKAPRLSYKCGEGGDITRKLLRKMGPNNLFFLLHIERRQPILPAYPGMYFALFLAMTESLNEFVVRTR